MPIQVRDLHFAYFEEGKDTIAGLSADFSEQKVTLLTGASGCGKSTLLYLIAGLYPHNAGFLRKGTITVDEKNPAETNPQQRSGLIGMMFQNPDLQFCMDTVENEMIFCLENQNCPPEEFPAKISDALNFCRIPQLRSRVLHTLSGGEKQRVALACLVMMNPRWLLLDEPFANVDDHSASEIIRNLQELHEKKGTGILAVDHRLEAWLPVTDRICVMKDGRMEDTDLDPRHLDAQKLESLGIIVPGGHYVSPYTGHINSASDDQPAVLVLDHFSVTREKESILTDITASFPAGSAIAIVGQSGCGKSTLFGALFGLYRYKGHALLNGKEVRRLGRKDLGSIGFVTQNPQDQFIGGTVRHEIEAALGKGSDAERKSEEILRNIKLWKYRDISPYMLSQGQQRRLGVAALMAYPCKLLICDEPTYAQDRNNTIAIMDSLLAQVRSAGVTLLFSTHDRQLARDYADVIYEMHDGKLEQI